jgi:hypothetical protein
MQARSNRLSVHGSMHTACKQGVRDYVVPATKAATGRPASHSVYVCVCTRIKRRNNRATRTGQGIETPLQYSTETARLPAKVLEPDRARGAPSNTACRIVRTSGRDRHACVAAGRGSEGTNGSVPRPKSCDPPPTALRCRAMEARSLSRPSAAPAPAGSALDAYHVVTSPFAIRMLGERRLPTRSRYGIMLWSSLRA